MLWFVIACLIVLWALGWGFHVAGNLVHALLIVAFILLIVNLATGKKAI